MKVCRSGNPGPLEAGRVVCIIQARMGSSRLPGKVLLDLCGMPVLWHVWQRVRHAAGIDEIVVATTDLDRDQVIQNACEKWGVTCSRGSETDVLSRYVNAAISTDANTIIRITSDCPLIDPDLISKQLGLFKATNPDYLSNVVEPRTFPKGFDTEIFTRSALQKAYREAMTPFDREHVTPFIRNNPNIFKVMPFYGDPDLSGLNFCLDTPDDYTFISQVYSEIYRAKSLFNASDLYKSQSVLLKFPGFAATLRAL